MANQFSNMTKIVNYINAHPTWGVHIQYSTHADYFDALHQDTSLSFPVMKPSTFQDNYNDFEYVCAA